MNNRFLDRRYGTQWLVGLVLAYIAPAAWSACTSPSNWLSPQGRDVKVFIGTAEPEGLGSFGDGGVVAVSKIDLPARLLGQEGKGSLVMYTPGGELNDEVSNFVFSYEPAGDGRWRLCRADGWTRSDPSAPREAAERRVTLRYIQNNPALSKLFPEHVMSYSTLYVYDANGHLASVYDAWFEQFDQGPQLLTCTRFDARGKITLWVDPKVSKKCPSEDPDLRDEWAQYKVVTKPDGTDLVLLQHFHRPDPKTGQWRKEIKFQHGLDFDKVPQGNVEADSVRGVTRIWGSNVGVKDHNASNMTKNRFGHWEGSNYTFLSGKVPLEVIDNNDLIYQFKRRRESYIDGGVAVLSELFMPHENRPRRRYYLASGYMERHEQLDAQGRIRRIITVEGWRQPRPGPKPEFNDDLLTDKGLRVRLHKIYHRVYDIDDKGVPKLVAVSWNKKLPLREAGRSSLHSIQGRVNVVYGTPDGKVVWQTKEAFEKAFDFSHGAAEVFPDFVAEREAHEAALRASQKQEDAERAARARELR